MPLIRIKITHLQPEKFRDLVVVLVCVDANELKLDFLLKQTCQNSGNIS